MHIILITGISGSGKSIALRVLEDAGYFCIDNLPPKLLRALVTNSLQDGVDTLVVATDARSADSLASLPSDIAQLKAEGHDVKVLFLTSSTEALVARFSETRRSHPLSHRIRPDQNPADRLTLIECIQAERELLVEIEGLGHTIDTSDLSTNKLRRWVKDLIDTQHASLTLMFESFAFKHGVPLDADLVFDVRMLPNPHYDPLLRPFTGRDQPVINFLNSQPQVADLLSDISTFVAKWLPSFKQDNRSYLTVAIGCTGGQHRSVYMVEQLAKQFAQTEQVVVRHRQLNY